MSACRLARAHSRRRLPGMLQSVPRGTLRHACHTASVDVSVSKAAWQCAEGNGSAASSSRTTCGHVQVDGMLRKEGRVGARLLHRERVQ